MPIPPWNGELPVLTDCKRDREIGTSPPKRDYFWQNIRNDNGSVFALTEETDASQFEAELQALGADITVGVEPVKEREPQPT